MKYDVFISYRRDGGAATARILRDRLTEMGYKVFFDVESLRSGYFNTALYSVIDQCKDVIVVLSPNALDHCIYEGDWVRREVEHALFRKKNVIPVFLRGFQFPYMLPPSMDGLRYCNGIGASEDFFDAFIEKLKEFLRSKPSFFQGLRSNRLLKRMIPGILAAVLVLAGFLGVNAFLRSRENIYPRTKQEKNLTQELVHYTSKNLTRIDILAENYSEAIAAARRYLSSGMRDDTAMKNQFERSRQLIQELELETAAPTEAFLTGIADSPFDSADVQALHENVLLFKDDCLHNLDYLETMLSPNYYPTDPEGKLEILDYYQLMLDENLNIFGYGANQMLLPITEEEALGEFWHSVLPTLTNIPLRATTWNRDFDALESAIEESFTAIEKAITDCAAIVGETAKETQMLEFETLQMILDFGYTQKTAENIWAYHTEDPEARWQQHVQAYLQQGYPQDRAEYLADQDERILAAQAEMRIACGAKHTDDINALWEKMTYLLRVDLYEEALECAILYQQQMTNSDQYLPGIQLFIHLKRETDLESGIMVMEYYTDDGINEVLQIGDVIYGFNGKTCRNTDEYIAMKEALTSDSYVVDVLRIDGKTGVWDTYKLTLTKDMPRVYLNDLVAPDGES